MPKLDLRTWSPPHGGASERAYISLKMGLSIWEIADDDEMRRR